MLRNCIPQERDSGDDLAVGWTADAAHRFAERTALAPRPLHQGCGLPTAGAGLASQLNPLAPQTPEGLVEQRGAAPPVRGGQPPPAPLGAFRRVEAGHFRPVSQIAVHLPFSDVVRTSFASGVEENTG